MNDKMIARVYLKQQTGEQVVVSIPGTNYQLHLRATGRLQVSPQGRTRGVIRCPVWKMDFVSAGGAFVDPLIGRPRRVQGHVVATMPETNSVVVEVSGTPIVGDLPQRYVAGEIAIGTRVGLDVPEGATFEPAPMAVPA